MPKKTFLDNLATEDIRPEDLDIDGPVAVPQDKPGEENEERFFPLLGIRCKVKDADRLLAEQQANNL